MNPGRPAEWNLSRYNWALKLQETESIIPLKHLSLMTEKILKMWGAGENNVYKEMLGDVPLPGTVFNLSAFLFSC